MSISSAKGLIQCVQALKYVCNTQYRQRIKKCVFLRAIGVLYMNLTFPLLDVIYMNKPNFVHFCFLFVTGHLEIQTAQVNLLLS